VRKGALIVNCCGYDSVPSDLGNMMMLRYAAEKFPGVNLRRVTGYLMGQGGESAVTIKSLMNVMDTNLQTLKKTEKSLLVLPR